MKSTRLEDLFLRYYHQDITVQEKAELMNLINDEQNKEMVNDIIDGLFQNEDIIHALKAESANEILASIFSTEPGKQVVDLAEAEAIRTNWWLKPLVAASVALLMIFGGYRFYIRKKETTANPLAQANPVKDVLPGGQRAQLRLSNGKIVNLAAVADGFLSSAQTIEVNKGKGEVKFSASAPATGSPAANAALNVLTTPMGGQYTLTLPDGSRAWLNAGSSLKFPDYFGEKRTVEMRGEVYFEIHPDKTKPFVVKVAGKKVHGKEMEIVVLGTHFNINSYEDEPAIQTTLLEGSVKITTGNRTRLLVPGQQAEVESAGADKSIKIKTVDTGRVVAWKDGRFEFNGNVKDIMRQISRWYDLDVTYQDDVGDKAFVGAISRKKNVSEVLKMLELTGDIHFELDGNRLIVNKL